MGQSLLERLAFWVKFGGSLLALVGCLGGVAWAGGGWMMDRQSAALSTIQHRQLKAELELRQEESEQRQAAEVESLRELLLRQHQELRGDIRDVHKRVDSLFRKVRDIE